MDYSIGIFICYHGLLTFYPTKGVKCCSFRFLHRLTLLSPDSFVLTIQGAKFDLPPQRVLALCFLI